MVCTIFCALLGTITSLERGVNSVLCSVRMGEADFDREVDMGPDHSDWDTGRTYLHPRGPGVVLNEREVLKDSSWLRAFYLSPEAVLALHLRWSDVQDILQRQSPQRGNCGEFCELSIFDMERKVVSLVEEVNTVCLETERGLPSLTWHAFRDVPGIVPEEDVLHGALVDRVYLHCSMQKLWSERDGSYFFTRELAMHFGVESVDSCRVSDQEWSVFLPSKLNRAQFAALSLAFGLHTYSVAARVAGQEEARVWSEGVLRQVMRMVNNVLVTGRV